MSSPKNNAAEFSYKELFKEHPGNGDCPICMIPFALDKGERVFKACCGQFICHGCLHAQLKEQFKSGKELKDLSESIICPFCRKHVHETDEEFISRLTDFVSRDSPSAAHANYLLAFKHNKGEHGIPRDIDKSIEFYLKAGQLGCAVAYYNLGLLYYNGDGVEADTKKAQHYWRLASIEGDLEAMYNLGFLDLVADDREHAFIHFKIAAQAGHTESLNELKKEYVDTKGARFVTKDEYAKALRSYHDKRVKTKSDARNEATVYSANPSLYFNFAKS